MTKNDYKDWAKSDLVKEVEKLKKRKKYGLVWEEKPEDVVEQCKRELPVLEEVKGKEIEDNSTESVNLLIEGDNYHSLSVLNYTHRNNIDVIYIDPPYNTGNKTWKYNNNYVDSEDAFRHSKWISFMSKRLKLAKNLLKDDGVIITTIDDYELFSLGHLMDEIFGEQNRLSIVTVLSKKSGRTTDRFFATCHEYYLFYSKNSQKAVVSMLDVPEEHKHQYKFKDNISRYKWRDFLRTGGYSTPKERPNSYYPIYYSEKTGKISTEKLNDAIKIFPLDSKGNKRVWRQTKPSLEELINMGEIKVERNRQGKYKVRIKDRVKKGLKPKTVWDNPKYDAATHGTKLLEGILGKARTFDFPKSLYAVYDAIRILTEEKKDALILDFFAGSGTTGHAVLEMNKDDGGNRRFILSTNNEDNNGNGLKIATDICYPRIEKVIKGYKNGKKKVKGLGGNLKYFRTSFVPAEPTDKNKTELTKKATEMLCVREDTFDLVKDEKKFKIFKGIHHHTGIVFDQLAINDFKKIATKINSPFSVYVFSLGDDTFEDEFMDMKDKVSLSPIPEAILRVYRRIFK